MQILKIKPASGARVLDPVTKLPLAADGEQKPRSNYWMRRISSGEVVIVVESASAVAAAKPKE